MVSSKILLVFCLLYASTVASSARDRSLLQSSADSGPAATQDAMLCPGDDPLVTMPLLCTLEGESDAETHRGSAADLLSAARFTDYGAAATQPAASLHGRGDAVPWVVADFSMSVTVSSSRLEAQRAVWARAAVDLFLCAGNSCGAVADLQYVSAGSPASAEGAAASLAFGYARIGETTVGLPLGWLEAARTSEQAMDDRLNKKLHAKIHPGEDIIVKQVIYPAPGNSSKVKWLNSVAPGMVPTSAWARAVKGGVRDLPIKVASFRASNLEGKPCVDIFVPDHPWMRAHGWGASHADCRERGAPRGLHQVYAFHSYFPQAFLWNVSTTFTDTGNQRTLTGKELLMPPMDLPTKLDDLERAWRVNHNDDDALWSYGRADGWDQQSSRGEMQRCVALVIGGAPIIACNLTERRVVNQSRADPNRLELMLGNYDNQKNAPPNEKNPVSKGLFNLAILQHVAKMGDVDATAKPLPWCVNRVFTFVGNVFGDMRFGAENASVLNCTLWDELHLGSAAADRGPGPLGPPARTFASTLNPTLVNISNGEYTGFAGWERAIGAKVEEVAGVLALRSMQRMRSHAELQMSLSDSTATWQGALTSTALLIVSWIAVASGRRDMEATLERWCRRALRWPAGKGADWADLTLATASKVVVFLISALGILLPLVLVAMGEQAARRNNVFAPKITWLQQDAPTYEGQTYQVVAAVALTVTATYDDVGYGLTWVNLSLGALAVILLAAASAAGAFRRGAAKPGRPPSANGTRECPEGV